MLCGRRPMVPKAPTIEEGHIIGAYVYGNKWQQDRIDAYIALSRKELAESIVAWPEGFTDHHRGLPTLPMWGDQRTSKVSGK